jgi:putative copper resistance protein D
MPPLTPAVALTTWEFAPLVTTLLSLLAACYLAAVWRVRVRGRGGARRGRPWPAVRTLAFLGGLVVIAVATQGSPGVYEDTQLTAHMVQHLLLIMVAPPLLVAGRPVTLLLHAARNPWHSRVKRVLRSRTVTALTWPPGTVAVYSAVVLCTHLTGLITARGALHEAEHGLYVLAGYLFFLPVVGSEPLRWRSRPLGRYLLLLAAMPADIVTGAVLMLHGPLGRYGAGDVRTAGLIMVAGGELVMVGLAMALAVAVVRNTGAREPDRAGAAGDLASYNAYLASLDAGTDVYRH